MLAYFRPEQLNTQVYLLPVDFSYEADVWGRVRSSVEASRANAQASLETIRLSMHAELATDYFQLRSLDALKQLLDSTVAAYEKALQLTTNRYKGGIASGADIAQAETQLETTRAQAIDTGVERAQLEHAIALLVGAPASTFSIPALSATPLPPEGLCPKSRLPIL
jgi:outer membrane protein TolC